MRCASVDVKDDGVRERRPAMSQVKSSQVKRQDAREDLDDGVGDGRQPVYVFTTKGGVAAREVVVVALAVGVGRGRQRRRFGDVLEGAYAVAVPRDKALLRRRTASHAPNDDGEETGQGGCRKWRWW
jgi:hypothetical protein